MTERSKITYLISGLGADYRTFNNLELSIGNIQHVPWHRPKYEQNLRRYAEELIENHFDLSQEIQIIGLSFGGLVAQEIAHILDLKDIILISSMRTRAELPTKFKMLSKMPLYDSLMNPKKGLEIGIKNRKKQFHIETEDGMHLSKLILEDTDPVFFKWAVKKIMNWNSPIPKNNFVQICGTKDPLFPFKKIINPTHVIEGGGHFMIYERAEEISKIINTTWDER